MITAEEFIYEKNKLSTYLHIDQYKQLMIEFAKLHVEQALKQALEDSPTGSSTDIPSYEDMKDSILNAYPL